MKRSVFWVSEVTDKVVAYKNQLEAAQEVVSENEMQYGWEDWFGEEETVMRDVILATILMGLALKVEKMLMVERSKCSKNDNYTDNADLYILNSQTLS